MVDVYPCDDSRSPRAAFSEPARRVERGCDGRRKKTNRTLAENRGKVEIQTIGDTVDHSS